MHPESLNNFLNSKHSLLNRLKTLYSLNSLSTLLFYISILFFIIGFNFSDVMVGNWYQQFLPPINNRPISDITFLDSLTGFAVTPYIANDTAYILKTTNGGDNWNRVFTGPTNSIGGFNRVQFLNLNTGYVCGNFLRKTTNGGINWFTVNTSGIFPMNMHVLNEDTIWLIDSDGLVGGVFRTTNGGLNWTNQLNLGSSNPQKIYMFNGRIGFVSSTAGLYKTTNSGINWNIISGSDGYMDMYFVDSLTGWKCSVSGGFMKKTTNGGLNWVTQILPSGGIIQTSGISSFSNINRDTIWSNGGYVLYPNSQAREMLYRTTDQGTNWLFQIPDTSIIISHRHINFTNKNNGWSYSYSPTGIHTTNGGDTTFYLSVKQISTEVPKEFKLFQNYPNPFNSMTKFKFSVKPNVRSQMSNVKIPVYDITGKEAAILVNENLIAGEYETTFNANNFSSGIYFYSLIIDGVLIDTRKMILVK